MLSTKLRALAALLHQRPDLCDAASERLQELSECVAALEQSAIPPHLHAAGILPLPANVVRFPPRVPA